MQEELEWLRKLEQEVQLMSRWREMKMSELALQISEVRTLVSGRIIEVLEARTASHDSSVTGREVSGSGRCPAVLGNPEHQFPVRCSWGAGHSGRHTFEADPTIYTQRS